MQTKKNIKKYLIIEADDFGISESANQAILRAYNDGMLTSTCVMANGEAFEEAMEDILPQCSEIGFGIHLNIIEGKSISDNPSLSLCDSSGLYKNGYLSLIYKSYDKKFLNDLEKDFRIQIEKVLTYRHVDHINSHVHTHAIPNIFELTCKLAQEYRIKHIRTQLEIPYLIPLSKKYFSSKYPINLIKNGLLNTFTLINKNTLKNYNLKTNNFFVGVNYTGYMDTKTIEYGLNPLKNKNSVTEVLIHPNLNEKDAPLNYQEFLSSTDKHLKKNLDKNGWYFTNYSKLSVEEGSSSDDSSSVDLTSSFTDLSS